MAILKDIACHVLVNDKPVQEYDDESEGYQGESHVTKFIESVSEARFKIKLAIPLSLPLPSGGLSVNLFIDGKFVTGIFADTVRFHSCKGLITINDVTLMDSTGLVRKPFIFNEIKRLEEATPDSVQLSKAILDGVGTITVKVERCVLLSRHNQHRRDATGLGKVKEIPEKKLKGMSLTHSTKLGLGTPAAPESVVHTRSTDHVPYAHFDFKYCSRKALQGMLLISQTPDPESRSVSPVDLQDRPIEDLSIEELRALAQIARKQTQPKSNVKNEGKAIKTERESALKRKRDDPGPSSKSARVKRPVETIDLSGDD